jgi:class 3 adenylate cyclase
MITEHFHSQLRNQLLSLDAVSIDATSYAMNTGQKWPTVTIPDFAIRGWTVRQQMKAETLGLLPVVSSSNRQEWENYVVENSDWIQTARSWETEKEKSALLDTRRLYEEVDFSQGFASSIYTVNKHGGLVVDEGIGPYAPIWMTSPSPRDERMVNYNLLSHHLFWHAIEASIESQLPVMSKALNLESSASHRTLTGKRSRDHADPISALLYPVFDSFDDQRKNLVALLAAEISWTRFFEHILPRGTGGIVCVVETACDQQFTYLVEGNEATFLGAGDYHDPKFTRMVKTKMTSQLLETSVEFAGLPMELEHCPFLLRIYPTESLQQEYSSTATILLACTLALLLSVTTGILVVNLQSKSRFAGQNTNIPTLIGGNNNLRKVFWKLPKFKRGPQFKGGVAPPHLKATLQTFPERITLSKSRHISLSNATVMFADILGLESWSTGKDPAEVTNLMQTVHRSLNVIAKRHGVPQVEMTSDSFVTVVGSDDSESDHAAILIYFACECRKRISELFKSISACELSIRFGVHSGHLQPNTAGNRELEHGRFEIFGETVDMTFQMLTNGKSNRIHLSVETAELLNLAGKSHWISPRSELIHVNGKGGVSTFWVCSIVVV